MHHRKFDRGRLRIKSLSERKNIISVEKVIVPVDSGTGRLPAKTLDVIAETASRIKEAKAKKRPVVLAFGAHAIKNGLSLILIELIRKGLVTHLATNGAGIIHDWEFAYQGKSGEDVRENAASGQFGIWEETGFYINLALVTGAYEGAGYGESVGKLIAEDGIYIPDKERLRQEIIRNLEKDPDFAAAATDFLGTIKEFRLSQGFMKVEHPFRKYSVQAAAWRHKVPFTGHPMFGHDIIYCHPLNNGAAVGRTAMNDFLCFTDSISRIDGGVYISLGSAVMSPMIFEKAFSMAQNLAIQKKSHIDNHYIVVVDLAKSEWDWDKDGEPPPDNPAYYLRYNKTFHRMGGTMNYIRADNRDFLTALLHRLL
jgi:hypothetical protein